MSRLPAEIVQQEHERGARRLRMLAGTVVAIIVPLVIAVVGLVVLLLVAGSLA